MVPMRTSTIFKSRWMALVWAAGIIWFAYDFAGAQPQAPANGANAEVATDAAGEPVTSEDQKRFQDGLNSF
jgi:hypothetical protein